MNLEFQRLPQFCGTSGASKTEEFSENEIEKKDFPKNEGGTEGEGLCGAFPKIHPFRRHHPPITLSISEYFLLRDNSQFTTKNVSPHCFGLKYITDWQKT